MFSSAGQRFCWCAWPKIRTQIYLLLRVLSAYAVSNAVGPGFRAEDGVKRDRYEVRSTPAQLVGRRAWALGLGELVVSPASILAIKCILRLVFTSASKAMMVTMGTDSCFLVHEDAAVHVNCRAGNVVRAIRAQESNGLGNVLRRADLP